MGILFSNSLKALIFGLMFVIGFTSTALAAQSAVSLMTVKPGTYNGIVNNLSLPNEGKIVNFYTNSKGNLTAIFQFSAVGLSSSLQLNARFMQLTGTDIFKLQYKNSSGIYTNISSITGNASVYKTLSFPLASSAIVNGSITIKIISSIGSNDCALDFLSISDAGSELTPVPAPAPIVSSFTTSSTNSSNTVNSIPIGSKWYLQLQGTVNANTTGKVYDIDLFDNSTSLFTSLKQSGHTIICYFSAGTYENWRSDANQFPVESLGNNVSGWPGENWLDTRNTSVRQIIANRMDLAKNKGCDGIDPDNVDGYTQSSGFPLTVQDQINYNTFLADQAHARGLIVGLKNSTDLVTTLVDKFDFAVVEECFKYNECSAYSPFINKNKPVLLTRPKVI